MDTEYTTLAADKTPLGYRLLKTNHTIALTMIHGLASNLTRWTEFINHTQLSNHCDLLRIDLRGRGLTPYRGFYNRQTWLNDIDTLLKKEAYQKTVIMGHSMGAQVALEFAYQQPEKTLGLILIDPVFPQALSGKLAVARKCRAIVWFLIRMIWFFNKIGLKHKNIPTRDLYQLDLTTRELLKNKPELSIADLYANPFDDAKYLPLANYLQDLYEVTRPLPDLHSINVPILVLLSKGAVLMNRQAIKEALLSLKNQTTTLIDADHWLLTEKPEESRLAIEQWFHDHLVR